MSTDFTALFDEWSDSYDETVAGHDPEYNEVFQNYLHILEEVVKKAKGNTIEFGVGTGNLTELLVKSGKKVCGIEPSAGMRKVAKQKLSEVKILQGDFLTFTHPFQSVDTIVSTYAFHHLTDDEKEIAIRKYSSILEDDGKIVFADTIFEDENAKLSMIRKAENKGFHRLANDLRTEYYTTMPILKGHFEQNGFTVTFTQKNEFVWLIEATKQRRE
ncbi:class I SAM-dependent DNA methyltransferase [Lederbergia panacisoli]|uniref:class I SAM-dependent DNA methyltransferase n=1 Tax=Lederbergia panacisoli TaxID=1255251 RepID=UPI00214C14D1|nr:class I SAM-dependent methyltransferase [Lederbergia panacisoli]MCR2823361.1 class I SAM-dependent methyltransferase [Lederbergia panacisoli]